MNYKIETAKQLLRIRAVFFRPEQLLYLGQRH